VVTFTGSAPRNYDVALDDAQVMYTDSSGAMYASFSVLGDTGTVTVTAVGAVGEPVEGSFDVIAHEFVDGSPTEVEVNLVGTFSVVREADQGGGTLLVTATVVRVPVYGITAAFVTVSDYGIAVNDATVTVNDTAAQGVGNGEYRIEGGLSVGPGQTVVLSVTTTGELTAGAVLYMPGAPNVTAPTAGTYDPALPITVEWTPGSPSPQTTTVLVSGDYTADDGGYASPPLTVERSYDIPPDTLMPDMQGVTVMLTAYNTTSDLGADSAAGSVFSVGSQATSDMFATGGTPSQ
jgi:hypothetical protein